MRNNNPIITATIDLLRAIHKSGPDTVSEADAALKSFADSWLVSGEMKPLAGFLDSTLSDTDITEAIRDGLVAWMDS